ncbi:MAG: hypothetical protein LBU36_06350, partial [Clostridiales bacterium]|nr:hypothetical protein [Clostridiales bacterium]
KKEAFSGGHERLQQLFGEAKIANANAGRPEKTPGKKEAFCRKRGEASKNAVFKPFFANAGSPRF